MAATVGKPCGGRFAKTRKYQYLWPFGVLPASPELC
jgi:hypothetical protein